MGAGDPHTQLQFNRTVPSLPDNLAARFACPRPIVIEKLRAPEAGRPQGGLPEGPRGAPAPFRVLSEEKLRLAVRLARRDVRRGPSGEPAPGRGAPARKARGPLPARQPPTRDRGPQLARPPTALELRRLQEELSACVRRLGGVAPRGEGAPRGGGAPDPSEAERGRVRRRERAVRTARTLYALQQQVKEIQEDLDKLSPHRIRHTKKSRAMSRLAAAHRGAIRALRMFVSQFTDSKEEAVSERCRDLGALIRQLSICSARLDTDPSVPVVVLDLLQQIEELDSLLERKQSLGKIKKCFPGVQSQSPLGFPIALERSFSTSPVRERKPLVVKERLPQERRRPAVRKLLAGPQGSGRRSKQSGDQAEEASGAAHSPDPLQNCTVEEDPGECTSLPLTPLGQMLGEGLKGQPEEDLASSDRNAFKIGPASTKAKTMKKRPLPAAGPLQRRSVETAAKSEQGFHKVERLRPCQAQGKDHRFQRMTASFRLKRSQPPVKDRRTPWIPPNPTSPPASPKCVAWGKGSASPQDAKREHSLQREAIREEGACADPIEHEAFRLAWLDAENARRLKELDELKARELADIQRLSTSTSELVDKVGKAVLERLKPLLERVEEASPLEADAPLGEALPPAPEKAPPKKELPDCTLHDSAPDLCGGTCTQVSQPEAVGFQDEDSPDLWIMMRRMEEMERYQEAVRQRFSQMVYADLDLGTARGTSNRKGPAVDERPRPPHPIQLTKKAASAEPKVNILLENPLDEKCFDESMDMEERGEKRVPLRPVSSAAPQQPEGSILLSTPREMLQSLGSYQDSYQQYLRAISHETIGNFNPWIIVESLAEELVEEALEDVAAELQDVCEDYAEAVFTSEFLEPSK